MLHDDRALLTRRVVLGRHATSGRDRSKRNDPTGSTERRERCHPACTTRRACSHHMCVCVNPPCVTQGVLVSVHGCQPHEPIRAVQWTRPGVPTLSTTREWRRRRLQPNTACCEPASLWQHKHSKSAHVNTTFCNRPTSSHN
jgi:hypothetical protein